ncbi:MAG: hypothetical protein IJ333_03155 [Clostridia bacterium]|nr:hypothetical protein [Clostridia bacterium]
MTQLSVLYKIKLGKGAWIICGMLLLTGCNHPKISSSESMTVRLSESIGKEAEPITLSQEDAAVIAKILEKGVWEEGSCWCYGDVLIAVGDQSFRYHLDGEITTSTHTRELSREEEKTINGILKNYINI